MANEGEKPLKSMPSYRELMGKNIVTLYVGPNKEEFPVHMDILCNKVPYFEKMFKGSFKESKAKVAHFPEDEGEDFEILLQWVYFDNFKPTTTTDVAKKNDTVIKISSWDPVKAYKFADKFCISELKDRIIDAYIKSSIDCNYFPTCNFMCMVYESIPRPSPFHRYMVQAFRWALTLQSEANKTIWSVPKLQSVLVKHTDFITDLLTSIREMPTPENPNAMPQCYFHCHEEGACYLNKEK